MTNQDKAATALAALRDEYPENQAEELWARAGIVFVIVRNRVQGLGEHYCGYVRLRELPPHHTDEGFDAEVDVNVHGGVTYQARSNDGSWVFGFDMSHVDDFTRTNAGHGALRLEARNIEWVREECERLSVALLTAPQDGSPARGDC